MVCHRVKSGLLNLLSILEEKIVQINLLILMFLLSGLKFH